MPDTKKPDNSQMFQLLWGCALLLMGLAFFFRIPEVMQRFSEHEHFFGAWYVRLSMYLVSVILIGGGGKKIYNVLGRSSAPESTDARDTEQSPESAEPESVEDDASGVNSDHPADTDQAADADQDNVR